MSRRVVGLKPEHLTELPLGCAGCAFWERGPVARNTLTREQAAEAKRAWVQRVEREWGTCGQVLLDQGSPIGVVIYAPPELVPGATAFPTAPVGQDAVLMTMLRTTPGGHAPAKMLVQAMARDLVKRNERAVEAFADARGRTGRSGESSCLVPLDLLTAVGFTPTREHPTTPRMRMDLRTTVPWKDSVEHAWERLRDAVRPAATPERPPARALRCRTDQKRARNRQEDGPVVRPPALAGSR